MSTTKESVSSLLVVQQGEAGRLGGYAFGLVSVQRTGNVDRPIDVATLATWPADAPQVNRNDYVSRHRLKTGNIFPLGAKLYRVEAVVNRENPNEVLGPELAAKLHKDAIVLNTSPVELDQISLSTDSFCISEGSTGELHGTEIRFVDFQRNDVNGKEEFCARIETWPNDYPRNVAVQNGLLRAAEHFAGSEISIGGKAHKIISLNEGLNGTIPWIEIKI